MVPDAPRPRPAKAPVLIASKWSFDILPDDGLLPWPECMLSAQMHTPYGDVELHNVHVPPWKGRIGGKRGPKIGIRKVETLQRIYERLAHQSERHRVLCGDFNTPEFELPGGQVIPFRTKEATQEQKERQARVERDVLVGLAEFGLTDVVHLLRIQV
jgi:exonuclease III